VPICAAAVPIHAGKWQPLRKPHHHRGTLLQYDQPRPASAKRGYFYIAETPPQKHLRTINLLLIHAFFDRISGIFTFFYVSLMLSTNHFTSS
jgi:hypothetical protein